MPHLPVHHGRGSTFTVRESGGQAPNISAAPNAVSFSQPANATGSASSSSMSSTGSAGFAKPTRRALAAHQRRSWWCGRNTAQERSPDSFRYAWRSSTHADIALAAARTIVGVYLLAFVCQDWVREADPGLTFSYLTNWGLLLTIAWLLGAGLLGLGMFVNTARGSRKHPAHPTQPVHEGGTTLSNDPTAQTVAARLAGPRHAPGARSTGWITSFLPLSTAERRALSPTARPNPAVTSDAPAGSHKWDLLRQALVIIFALAMSAEITITAFYWLVLVAASDGTQEDNFQEDVYDAIQSHTVVLFLAVDLALNRVVIERGRFWLAILFMVAYLIINVVYYAAADLLVYKPIDWRDNVPIALLISAAAIVFNTAAYFGLAWLSVWKADKAAFHRARVALADARRAQGSQAIARQMQV